MPSTTTTKALTKAVKAENSKQRARKPKGATAAEVRAAQAARLAAKPERTTAPRGPRAGGTLAACLEVLKDATEPMSAEAIYEQIKARNLAPGLKGKTPIATVGAQLATANKKGEHVTRPKPGLYALRAA